jgi:hypothetical protein
MSLNDLPENFDTDSEEDLRFAVANYFRELGFDSDEFSFEDQFSIRLGHNTLVVTKESFQSSQARGRSDLLLTRHGQPIAIVETKAPDHGLIEDDAWQAISYARLLREIAPFAIVTNGKDTQIYDTFSPNLRVLPDPADSTWHKSDQEILSISQDLKYEAARKLIGINPQTLTLFCHTQLENSLEDLRGSVFEGKKYIPDVYISREAVLDSMGQWLKEDYPCFTIVGESGVGKTNIMCAAAESMSADNFVLFYPGMRLANGLMAAIRNDFIWEFHREREIAYIVERFIEVTDRAQKQLIIFVDGIDEFPDNYERLKAELLDFIPRLRDSLIRVVLSCKSFDWHNFVIDKGQSFNRLAKSTYPTSAEVHNPEEIKSPDEKKVGFWLPKFTVEELDAVFPKYKSVFSLQGQLKGATREECQMPLMLRFIAEVYSNRDAELPASISSRELYDLYWDRRLNELDHRTIAENLLVELARLCIESSQRQVYLSELMANLTWTDSVDETYADLLRLGFISLAKDENDYERISFEFEKMRSYTYTVKTRRWPTRNSDEVARTISGLLSNPLGVEAIEFYLKTIDRGESDLLTEFGLRDFNGFVQIISNLDIDSSISEDVPEDQQQESLFKRLHKYADSYSKISRRYFPELWERIEPYSKGEVGVWVNRSMYQFRARTDVFPQTIVEVPDEVAAMLWQRTAPQKVYDELMPAGIIYRGMRNLVEKSPHKLAWERLQSQVADLVTGRALSEAESPLILQERIWDTLIYQPSAWLAGTPIKQKFWLLMGFDNEQIDTPIMIEELLSRTENLLQDFFSNINSHAETRGWYLQNFKALLRLHYWLELLIEKRQVLEPRKFASEEMFGHARSRDLSPIVGLLETLVPDILESYRSLIMSNFSPLSERFSLFNLSSPMLIEVSRDRHSNFLRLAYIILPSSNLSQRYVILWRRSNESIAQVPLINTTVRGTTITQEGKYGRAPISVKLDDIQLGEPNALLLITRFPSRTPILDQVYQLIGIEAKYLFGNDLRWSNLESGLSGYKRLDRFISNYYARRSGIPYQLSKGKDEAIIYL